MATERCRTRIVLGFALALTILSDFGICQPVIFGLINESVTLSPFHKTNFEDITWKKKKDKVAEWLVENSQNDHFSYYPPFDGRTTLDPQSGNLTIQYLMASDEGQYEIESSNLAASESMTLHVVERLPQPNLTCASDEENITISCYGPENSRFLNYTWKIPGPYVPLSEKKVQLSGTIDGNWNIQCIVSNPMSTNKSSLFLRNCVPETNSARDRSGIIGAIFLPIVVMLYISGAFGHAYILYP